MSYDPSIHHRRSIRAQNYDYTSPGDYFVTICTRNRACLFGEIVSGEIHLSPAGEMIRYWWECIPSKYESSSLDTFIVMPNYFHGIISIEAGEDGWSTNDVPISDMIGWFKTMSTNSYIRGVKQQGWPRFDRHLWQGNYYERIIRDDAELDRIRDYIAANPFLWPEVEENPNHL